MNPTWIIFVFKTIASYIIILIFFNEKALEGLNVALLSIRQTVGVSRQTMWVSHQTGRMGVTSGMWVSHQTGSGGVAAHLDENSFEGALGTET